MGRPKIFITGATGFIGRHLVDRLLKEGGDVCVLTRGPDKVPSEWKDRLIVLKGDLSDKRFELPDGTTLVFHCAGEIKDKDRIEATNVLGTKNLLEAVRRVRPKKYIHLSSAGVTGQRTSKLIDEETLLKPLNDYERSKWESERLVRDFAGYSGVPISILRPTNVIGEGKENFGDSFYQLIRHIKGGRFFYIGQGSGAANYVYVRDVVRALLALSRSDAANGQTYIVNDQTSIRNIVEAIRKRCRLSGRVRNLPYLPVLTASAIAHAINPAFALSPARVRALCSPYRYSAQKIKAQLGFEFEYGIWSGIERTIEWLERRGWA